MRAPMVGGASALVTFSYVLFCVASSGVYEDVYARAYGRWCDCSCVLFYCSLRSVSALVTFIVRYYASQAVVCMRTCTRAHTDSASARITCISCSLLCCSLGGAIVVVTLFLCCLHSVHANVTINMQLRFYSDTNNNNETHDHMQTPFLQATRTRTNSVRTQT
jgi:hypothetical protein